MRETERVYNIEKSLWTDSDFETMNWHDSIIYGLFLGENYELNLDVDYIFHWINPIEENENYKFWISPCTLVFENVHDLKLDIEISEPFRIEIDSIYRENPQKPRNADFIKCDTEYEWVIETQQGQISFKSIGYKQFVRQLPILQDQQRIEFEERKGISFSRNVFIK
jgi:hypothetical protein